MNKRVATALKNAIKNIDSVCMENNKQEWAVARTVLWNVLDKYGWNFTREYKLYRK